MDIQNWTTVAAVFSLVTVLLTIAGVWRLRTILNPQRSRPNKKLDKRIGRSAHLLIVLGSGGHTAEMIAMLHRATTAENETWRLDWQRFTHRTWIVSSGDSISAHRARQFENDLRRSTKTTATTYEIKVVPRAREIHQPLYTAPISSLRCLYVCISVLTQTEVGNKDLPDLILCNGPATATIMVFTSILMRFFNVRRCNSRGKMRTIYVESWARVKRLSLSGLLLSNVVDRFLVQWPQLEGAASRAEYAGVLI